MMQHQMAAQTQLIVDKLRSRLQYIPQTAKTARFQHSFLIYALNNYQT